MRPLVEAVGRRTTRPADAHAGEVDAAQHRQLPALEKRSACIQINGTRRCCRRPVIQITELDAVRSKELVEREEVVVSGRSRAPSPSMKLGTLAESESTLVGNVETLVVVLASRRRRWFEPGLLASR
jgi:hypothetical protein